MFKYLFWFGLVAFTYITLPLSFATELSFQPTTSQKNKPKLQYPERRPILSPEEFSKQVTAQGQKVNSDLTQQANQSIKKMTQGSGSSSAASISSPSSQPPAKPKKNAQTPTAAPQQSIPNITPPPTQHPAEPTASEGQAPSSTYQTPSQQPPESEVYTGYPKASPSGTQGTPQQPESDNGWNLHY